MGGHNSKAQVDQIALNKTVSNTMMKTQTSQSASANSVQVMKLRDLKYKNCSLNISQNADITVTVVQQFSSEAASQLTSDVKQEIENQIKNKMAPHAEAFSPPQVTTTVSNLKSRVSNIIENNLTVENLNQQVATVNNYQEEDIKNITFDACPGYSENIKYAIASGDASIVDAVRKMCDTTKDCTISQNAKLTLLAQQVTDTLIKSITEDKKVQELTSELEQVVTPTSVLMSPTTGIVLIVLSICLVIGFFLFVKMRSGGGGAPPPMPYPMMMGK